MRQFALPDGWRGEGEREREKVSRREGPAATSAIMNPFALLENRLDSFHRFGKRVIIDYRLTKPSCRTSLSGKFIPRVDLRV